MFLLEKIQNLLDEGYKEAKTEFSEVASPDEVDKTISIYKELVNRNQVKGNERNIDYWRKQKWDAFKTFVDELKNKPSKTQIKRQRVIGKSINLQEDDDWLIVIPLNKEASCFHGRKSSWCTTKPNQSNFEQYFYDKGVVLIYCLQKKTGGMWAVVGHKDIETIEMFTQDDTSISESTFKRQTGLDARNIVNKALGDKVINKEINDTRQSYKDKIVELDNLLDEKPLNKKKIEELLRYTKSGEKAVKYIKLLAAA